MSNPGDKQPHQSKTIKFAILLAFVEPILENLPELKALLAEYYGLAFVIIASIVGGLRFITSGAIRWKNLKQNSS